MGVLYALTYAKIQNQSSSSLEEKAANEEQVERWRIIPGSLLFILLMIREAFLGEPLVMNLTREEYQGVWIFGLVGFGVAFVIFYRMFWIWYLKEHRRDALFISLALLSFILALLFTGVHFLSH